MRGGWGLLLVVDVNNYSEICRRIQDFYMTAPREVLSTDLPFNSILGEITRKIDVIVRRAIPLVTMSSDDA